MKSRMVKIVGICLVAAFIFSGITKAATSEGEAIDSFVGNYTVRSNGIVNVAEDIQYDFGTSQKHGIFRTIPLTSKDGPDLDITTQNVADNNGEEYRYADNSDSEELYLKIGDPNDTVTGKNGYIVTYDVRNVIRSFADHDELYWNVTGNDWMVPINGAKGIVSFEPGTDLSKIKAYCYTGAFGSKATDCSIEISTSTQSVIISATRALAAGDGLTIDIAMPKGVVATGLAVNPTWTQKNEETLILFAVGAFVLLFIIMMVTAIVVGSRKYKRKIIIPRNLKNIPIAAEYNAPQDIDLAEFALIAHDKFFPTDFGAFIIDLAINGFIKISYIRDSAESKNPDDYQLTKLKDPNKFYKKLFDEIFDVSDEVRISTIATSSSINEAFKDIESAAQNKLLIDGSIKNPKPKLTKIAIGFLIWFAVMFIGMFISPIFFIAGFFSLFLTVLIGSIVAKRTNKLTPKGDEILKKIIGFYDFLKMTESEKLKLLNAPKLEPELFEKCLPYAILLGVEKEWGKQFENIVTEAPKWLDQPGYTGGFNAALFASSIGGFSSSLPYTSSSGSSFSSGSSGSGSSGGGSGGGGGGSW